MGPKRRIALVGVVLVLGALAAVPSAYACPKFATHCFEQLDSTTPANGTSEGSTDVVPTKSTQGTEYVKPFTSAQLSEFDATWETITDAFPKLSGIPDTASGKFVKRVITCAIFAKNVTDLYAKANQKVNVTAGSTDTSQLFLTICLQMVYETQNAGVTGAVVGHAASNKCATAVVSIPMLLSRSGSKYSAKVSAVPSRARGALKLSCRVKGTGVQITMQPRKRGRKLGQVIGNHMSIGFSNPTSKAVKIHTVFGFS